MQRTGMTKLGARSNARLLNGLSHLHRHFSSPNIFSAPRSPGWDVSGRKQYMTTNMTMASKANNRCSARQLAKWTADPPRKGAIAGPMRAACRGSRGLAEYLAQWHRSLTPKNMPIASPRSSSAYRSPATAAPTLIPLEQPTACTTRHPRSSTTEVEVATPIEPIHSVGREHR